MKVVQINGCAYRGSTGKIVSTLSDMLHERDDDSLIICSGYKEKTIKENAVCISGPIQTRIHQTLGYLFGDAGFHSVISTWKAIAAVKRIKPDVVHLHHLESYYIHAGMLLKYLKRNHIPTVWTFHDCWPLTGHCTHFTKCGCEKWKTECHTCPLTKAYPYSLFLDRSKGLFRRKQRIVKDWRELRIVNVSHWMDAIVRQSMYRHCVSSVVYNGVDQSIFNPEATEDLRRKLHLEDRYIILGVASRWGEGKGLDLFLALAEALKEDPTKTIVLVGLSDEQIARLPKNVIGVRRTSNQTELKNYYVAADVFLNLSAEETMGLVSVEAMACGVPTIVCPTTANPEIVNDECGYVLKERSVSGVLDALRIVQERGKAYYSSNCIQRVHRFFTVEKMVQGYYGIYEEMSRKR